MEISKVIIPAAGLGSSFLPYTKAVPKEMLPLLNKPAIQYVIEEALQSELLNFFIVSNKFKNCISDYFDYSLDTDLFLKKNKDKAHSLENLNRVTRQGNFTYIRQPESLGLAHAILMAKNSINKEFFSIVLPNHIIVSKQPALSQLIRIARQEKASIIGVQEISSEHFSSNTMIGIKKQINSSLFQVSHVVDKPTLKNAPSSLALTGRFILSHKIFNSLEEISRYSSEEIVLADAISHMIQQNERVYAYKVQGNWYDIGNTLGWIKALISMSYQDPVFGPHIKKYLNEISVGSNILYSPAKTIETLL